MPKALKIVAIIVGLVVALVLVAAIVLPLVVDPNDFRDEIAQAAEDRTGLEVSIDGELSLSVFPWLGVEVGALRLSNPPGFGAEPMAAIGSAAVGAKLLPLLSRRLEVSTVRLDGLRLNLVRLPDGRANWESLADEAPETPPEAAADDDAAFAFEGVDGLRLTDAVVRYQDQSAGETIEFAIPSLSAGELAPGSRFPVEGEATMALGDPATRVEARFEATVALAEDLSSVTVSGLSLGLESHGEALPGGTASGQLSTPSLRVALEGPSVELGEFRLEGTLSGESLPAGALTARLQAPGASLDMAAQTFALPSFTAEVAGVGLSGALTGKDLQGTPALDGRLAIPEFSPRAVLERLGQPAPPTADPDALKTASFETRLGGTAEALSLTALRLTLDDTLVEGEGELGPGEPTRVRARLAVDAIDLDRYLPPEPEEAEETPPPAEEDTELAFEWLRGLDLDARLTIGRLRLSGLNATGVEARAVAKDGVLRMEPMAAELYGGRLQGRATLDARRSPARFSLDQTLSSLELLPFARDLAGFTRLDGTAEFAAKLETSAATTADLLKGLNGELSFDVNDGVYMGMNLWWEIQRAWAIIKQREVPEKTSDNTEFRDLVGRAVIEDGIVRNDQLTAGLPFLALAGKGRIDLVESTLDYDLDATVVRQAADEASGTVKDLAGATVPMDVTGKLSEPKVRVDLGDIVRQEAGKKVLEKLGVEGEEGQRTEDAVKDKVEKEVGRKLKDLFGD